jgi:hypothetical protein
MRIRLSLPLFVALALAACDATSDTGFAPPAQAGRLRVVNASPDTARARTVNARIDGVPLAANLAYKGVTTYALTLAGTRAIAARKTADTSIVVFDTTVTIADATDYSVLVTGTGSDVRALVLADTNAAPPSGSVRIRVLHASPGMGPVDVYVAAPGADLTAETPDATNLAFRAATTYLTLPAGSHEVRFTTTGTKTVVLTGPTLALTGDQIRTVVALDAAGGGMPFTFATLNDR